MHRLILGLKFGDKREVDHINRDGIDNRKCNLRIVNRNQQNQNRRAVRNRCSKYRGVCFAKCDCCKSFRAAFKKDGKTLCEVIFATEKMAALYYDLIAYKHNSKYNYLNFKDIKYYEIKNIISDEIKKQAERSEIIRKNKGKGNENNIGKKLVSYTKYTGVGYRKERKKPWYAFCYIDGKRKKHIGSYATEAEAAMAFDEYVINNKVEKYLQHLNCGR